MYKGNAENKDIISLLIYLANRGYLKIDNDKIDLKTERINLSNTSKNSANQKITELQDKIAVEKRTNPNSQKIKYYENMLDIYKNIDKPIDYKQYGLKSTVNKLNKKNEFLIKKLKDYDGENINEQWFMEGLFECGRTEVTDKMLYNNFYITNNKILHNINNKQNKDKIFEKNTFEKSIVVILLIIVSILTILAIPAMEYIGVGELDTTMLLCILYISFFAVGIFNKISLIFRMLWLGFTILLSCFFLSTLPILEAITNDSICLLGFILGTLCIMGMIVFLKLMPKRTKYGNEMLGKIKGFKKFLETAEKEKLEAMVLENPNYFYDILPFTYVLNVSDKWIKKFEAISLQSPSWYDSYNEFNISNFETFVNSTMSSAQSVMSSSPFSNSGGGSSDSGSSGGGSSGGGSGGGGGGSW